MQQPSGRKKKQHEFSLAAAEVQLRFLTSRNEGRSRRPAPLFARLVCEPSPSLWVESTFEEMNDLCCAVMLSAVLVSLVARWPPFVLLAPLWVFSPFLPASRLPAPLPSVNLLLEIFSSSVASVLHTSFFHLPLRIQAAFTLLPDVGFSIWLFSSTTPLSPSIILLFLLPLSASVFIILRETMTI